MSESVASQQKGRGRPRSEKARTAILDAATELLLEQGLETVSMDEVAERASVSKATIYRWWPSKETLALDALYREWDTTRPRAARHGLAPSRPARTPSTLDPARPRAPLRPRGRGAGHRSSDRSRVRVDLPRAVCRAASRAGPRAPQSRGRSRRALRGCRHRTHASTLVYGPLYHRLLHGHAPLNDRFVRDVVDAVLTGLGVVSTP